MCFIICKKVNRLTAFPFLRGDLLRLRLLLFFLRGDFDLDRDRDLLRARAPPPRRGDFDLDRDLDLLRARAPVFSRRGDLDFDRDRDRDLDLDFERRALGEGERGRGGETSSVSLSLLLLLSNEMIGVGERRAICLFSSVLFTDLSRR